MRGWKFLKPNQRSPDRMIPTDTPQGLDGKGAGRQRQASPDPEPPTLPYAMHKAAVAVALAWAIFVVLGVAIIATLGWHMP